MCYRVSDSQHIKILRSFFAYFMFQFEQHLSHRFQLSLNLIHRGRINGFIASIDLKETETELGENKALYKRSNYCVFGWLSSLNRFDVICGLGGLRFRVHFLPPWPTQGLRGCLS